MTEIKSNVRKERVVGQYLYHFHKAFTTKKEAKNSKEKTKEYWRSVIIRKRFVGENKYEYIVWKWGKKYKR